MSSVRWGFIGCGAIARGFADGLLHVPDARLEAVAARDPERAARFLAEGNSDQRDARVLPDYRSLIHDPDIDVVYIATTHHNHIAIARAAIAAGKPVLLEKPVGLHAEEVAELIREARAASVFLMEAMWMRFIPAVRAFLNTLAEGVIGPVNLVQADFGIAIESGPNGRMLNPDLGGGSLWDLGIYPVTFARLVYGADPEAWFGLHQAAPETGVDQQAVIVGRYPGGGLAQLQCGFRTAVPHQARVYGPGGRIVLDDFFHGTSFRVEPTDGDAWTVEAPYVGTGYQFEAIEVQRCLRAGLTESPACPLDETLAIITSLDDLVTDWGLTYPPSRW